MHMANAAAPPRLLGARVARQFAVTGWREVRGVSIGLLRLAVID